MNVRKMITNYGTNIEKVATNTNIDTKYILEKTTIRRYRKMINKLYRAKHITESIRNIMVKKTIYTNI